MNFKKEQAANQSPESLKSILEIKLDLEDKTHIKYNETVTNAAILVHLKQNIEKNRLNEMVQTSFMNLWVTIVIIQYGMM